MIALKSVAWKDNRARKESGEEVKSDDVRKHLNDIVKLLGILSADATIQLPEGLMLESVKAVDFFMKSEAFIRHYENRISVPLYRRRLQNLFQLVEDEPDSKYSKK